MGCKAVQLKPEYLADYNERTDFSQVRSYQYSAVWLMQAGQVHDQPGHEKNPGTAVGI